MTAITFTLDDDTAVLLTTAFCAEFGYQPNDQQTPQQFAQQKVVDYCRSIVKRHLEQSARETIATQIEAMTATVTVTEQ